MASGMNAKLILLSALSGYILYLNNTHFFLKLSFCCAFKFSISVGLQLDAVVYIQIVRESAVLWFKLHVSLQQKSFVWTSLWQLLGNLCACVPQAP